MSRLVIETPSGPAWVDLDLTEGRMLLVIGHGAGGSVESADLIAVRDACRLRSIGVARVTQPYRVAGKKAPPRSPVLDESWVAVLAALGRRSELRGLGFVYAGRSSGARVACRTAADPTAQPPALAVVALAFPLHPPGKPAQSRLVELAAVEVPVLVVQGTSDAFGMPQPAPGRDVVPVPGDHSLKRSAGPVGTIVAAWIEATVNQ